MTGGRRPFDPSCPECRRELERHMALWQAQYDEVDHGPGLFRLLFEHYCTHRREPGAGGAPPLPDPRSEP